MPYRMTRREFLAAAAMAPLAGAAGARIEPRTPNFVFILTDDHRWDAMSCAGHPIVFTPNIDRIAREGARFANAFVTTSLCSPSRATLLTGRYAHSHGVKDNATHLDPSVPTFPQVLQKAGYETALVGKWHMDMQPGPQPGFDRWISFAGQGVYYNPVINIDGRTCEVAGYITDLLTSYAIDWLRRPRTSPFCLYLSHKALHADFRPAVRHSKLYSDAPIVPPASILDTLEGKPAYLGSIKRVSPEADDYPEFVERVRNYYRTLAAVDESVGRVLTELERMGTLDETVVIFAGDNGFLLGEHGLGDKRAMYEESIRIPLLIRYPALVRPGRVISEMALNLDVCPTILDLAGAPAPDGVQGRSLRPLLRGRRGGWRSDFLYEYYWEAEAKKRPSIKGVRTSRWKYVTYPDSDNVSELYDLESDPREMRNLVSDPRAEGTLRTLQSRLDELTRAAR